MKRGRHDDYLQKSKRAWEEVVRKTDERRAVAEEKYRLGRKVIQVKDYHGLKKGRAGWVCSVWPKTRVVFEDDGREPDIHLDLCACLETTDEYYDGDIDTLVEDIQARVKMKGRKKNER